MRALDDAAAAADEAATVGASSLSAASLLMAECGSGSSGTSSGLFADGGGTVLTAEAEAAGTSPA